MKNYQYRPMRRQWVLAALEALHERRDFIYTDIFVKKRP